MILAPVLRIPTVVSPGAIVMIIAGAVVLSLRGNARTDSGRDRRATPGARRDVPGAPAARAVARRGPA